MKTISEYHRLTGSIGQFQNQSAVGVHIHGSPLKHVLDGKDADLSAKGYVP
jgi:hypothetical protein